jgi:hypothetical protein
MRKPALKLAPRSGSETPTSSHSSPGRRRRAALALGAAAVALGPWLLSPRPVHAAAPALSISLAPNPIGVEDTTVLNIEVRGEGFGGFSARPDFSLDNLEVVAGPSRSESLQFVNGHTTRSMTLSWRLRPLAQGIGRVKGIKVIVDDQTLALADQEVGIQPGSLAPPETATQDPFQGLFGPDGNDPFGSPFARPRRGQPTRPQRSPKVFLRAEASPERPFVGQQVTYTVALYTQTDVSQVAPRATPTFHGCWVQDIPQPDNPRAQMVQIDGERYGRVVLLQKALFPLAAGTLELEPFRADLGLQVAEPGLFGPLFVRTQSLGRATDAVTLHVQPLPPAPPGFSGAVGQLRVTAHLDPTSLVAGEASTLTVRLEGDGHFQGLPDPSFVAPAGLRVFPPHEVTKEEVVGGTVHGQRTWNYVLVAERAGNYTLPAITVPYFEPASGRFASAAAAPLALAATPAVTLASAGGPASDTADHAVTGPTATTPAAGAATTSWPALTALGPIAGPALLGAVGASSLLALIFALRSGSLPGRGRTSRRQAGRQLVAQLATAAGETRPRQAAGAIEDAWRSFLSTRWDVPPGTPSTQWGTLLASRGADAGAAGELVKLADDLHYLRYAPQLSSCEALQSELVTRGQQLAKRLR